MRFRDAVLLACFLYYFFDTTNASAGDRSPWYRRCVERCIEKSCGQFDRESTAMEANNGKLTTEDQKERSDQNTASWYLRLLGWGCESECGYKCMSQHVELRILRGQSVQQYHGKWPFRRVWGIQELFASLFSLGNGLPHLYHALRSQGLFNPPGHYMSMWMTWYTVVGINTWLWSAVFHARDVRWTEAADYFCALLNIFYCVWMVLLRVAGVPSLRSPVIRIVIPAIGFFMACFYCHHIWYMWTVEFDYGYNMKVALVMGLVHTFSWLSYCYRIRQRSYSRRGVITILLLNAAILLEVGDFPPVAHRLIDAHAVWHGVTIPLGFSWYKFLISDMQYGAVVKGA